MIKITCLFVFTLIGAVFTLPASDAVNQRDPVQIKTTDEEPIYALVKDENPSPLPDLNESLDPSLGVKDENLEPAETFGFGYGIGWGGGYRGLNGYGGYGGYGGRGWGGYGYGQGYGGYSGGWGRGYGGRRYGGYYW